MKGPRNHAPPRALDSRAPQSEENARLSAWRSMVARNGRRRDHLLSDIWCLRYDKVSDNLAAGTAEADARPTETMAIYWN